MTPRVTIHGLGAIGRRVADYLRLAGTVEIVAATTGASGIDRSPVRKVPAGTCVPCDVAVLAVPVGQHASLARQHLEAGADVVSVSDSVHDINELLALDDVARRAERRLAVGAAFSPGYTCLLSDHARRYFDEVSEIHIAKNGTGGPACARQHHAALKKPGWQLRDGDWLRPTGGSGRELVWFPGAAGSADCYHSELGSPLLLEPAFSDVRRLTARVAATRRDRFTSRLPMLTPPHAEGSVGGVRVEVRGHKAGIPDTVVLGALDYPARGAAIVATAVVEALLTRVTSPSDGGPASGASGLASWRMAPPLLLACAANGLKPHVFEGSGAQSSRPPS